ncbi:hypothetical protein BH09PSE4_BH09PSE4_19600 [soil metagenome]
MRRLICLGLAVAAGLSAVPASARTVLTFRNSNGWYGNSTSEPLCAEGVCVALRIKPGNSDNSVQVIARFTNDTNGPLGIGARLTQNYPSNSFFHLDIAQGGSRVWEETMDAGLTKIFVYVE